MFVLIGTWFVLLTPMGEPCHVLQRKLGHALEAASCTHVDYIATVDRQRALYNGAWQWKELQKCVHNHVQPDKRSRLQRIPTCHGIRWSQANARRKTAFLHDVPWVARHFNFKVQYSTKEDDVWEDCHDATLLAWGLVYGDILDQPQPLIPNQAPGDPTTFRKAPNLLHKVLQRHITIVGHTPLGTLFLMLILFLVPSHYVILAGTQFIGGHTQYFVVCGLGVPSVRSNGEPYGMRKHASCKIQF